MASKYDLSFRDWDGETSQVGFFGVTLDAANIVAQEALMAALRSAIEAVTIGATASRKIIAVDEVLSQENASTPLAQRENKWLVRYTDGTTVFTSELPCADLSLLANNSNYLDLTSTEGAALVSAIEDYVVRNGQSVTVLDIAFVGRSI